MFLDWPKKLSKLLRADLTVEVKSIRLVCILANLFGLFCAVFEKCLFSAKIVLSAPKIHVDLRRRDQETRQLLNEDGLQIFGRGFRSTRLAEVFRAICNDTDPATRELSSQ